jgi:hypothetical protein
MNKWLVAIPINLILTSTVVASEVVHQFQSPAFIPGSGFSQHVLTIHQLEESKKKEIKAA